MPIVGLTDRVPAFKEIGRIYKGSPKTKTSPGRDLQWFRVKFRKGESRNLANLWDASYGTQPTAVNFRLAFPDIERSWDAWYEAYLKGGQIGKADGERWVYLRDPKSNEIVVKDYELTEYGRENGFSVEFDPSIPITSWKNSKGQDMGLYAKPRGRLRIVVPELMRLSYMTVITGSYNDVGAISAELAAIKAWGDALGIPLNQIPLVISRRPEEISIPTDQGRARMEKWMLHISVSDGWSERAFKMLDATQFKPFDMIEYQPAPALPSGAEEDYDVPEPDADDFDDPFGYEPPAPEGPYKSGDWADQGEDYAAFYGVDVPQAEPEPEPIHEEPAQAPGGRAYSTMVDLLAGDQVITPTHFWTTLRALGYADDVSKGFIPKPKDKDEHPDWRAALQNARADYESKNQ